MHLTAIILKPKKLFVICKLQLDREETVGNISTLPSLIS